MTALYLVRHGDYVEDRLNGQGPIMDLGLSPKGRAQAEALRSRLATSGEIRPDVFLSSTERRALETADLIAEAVGQPVIHDRDLEEWRRDGGTLDGDAFMAQWRSLTERRRPFHRYAQGCETGLEFSTRVLAALDRIVTLHAGKTVMLMTHGGVIQLAFQFFFGYGDAAFRRAYPAAGHASITLWRKEAGSERWALEFANDRHHL